MSPGPAVRRKTFSAEDVIFISLDKNTGFTFGTPYIVPVLDDVRALRRLEEIAEIVGGKTVDFNINDSTAWALMMEPLRNLKIIFVLQRYSPEFPDEVLTFYGKEIENITIPIDDLYDFTRLCVNALVRASGQPCEW